MKNFVPLLVRCSTSVWRMTVPGLKPPCLLVMVALESAGLPSLRHQPFWPPLLGLQPSSAASFLTNLGVLFTHMWSKLCLYGVKAMTSLLRLPLWTSDRRPGMSLWSKSLMTLLDNAPDARSRARLLAVATKESGAWLHALPISAVGLRMGYDIIRIATGLHLGVPICRPHHCQHCYTEVNELGLHGLSCVKSTGRHFCHAAVNSNVQMSLASAKIPSMLEPSGLFRSDGKRPDGITIDPWKSRRSLLWDFTCPDTYATSYVQYSTSEAEARKKEKYIVISRSHQFIPFAIETSGAFGHDPGGSLLTLPTGSGLYPTNLRPMPTWSRKFPCPSSKGMQ